MQYKNRKAMFRSSDGDTNFFNIVAGVLQRDILAADLFIICLEFVFRKTIDIIKENDFTHTHTHTHTHTQKTNKKKQNQAKSRQYPAENITDADYADDLTLLLS